MDITNAVCVVVVVVGMREPPAAVYVDCSIGWLAV